MKKAQKLGLIVGVGVLVGGVLTSIPSYAAIPGVNTLVSYDSTNTGVASSYGDRDGQVSEDGNIVVWTTDASNVVSGSPPAGKKLYKRNMQTGATSIESVDSSGTPIGIGDADFAMSRTGRFVIFGSTLSNIVTTHTVPSGIYKHIYIRDTLLGTNVLVDQSASGVLGNNTVGKVAAVSDDGRFIVFTSSAKNLLPSGNPASGNHIYIKDMQTGKVTIITSSTGAIGDDATLVGQIKASCDGSLIMFKANAMNLTPQDDGQINTYLVDLRNGYDIKNLTYQANQDVSPLSISCNGRYISMYSTATNLTADSVSGTITHEFRYDRIIGEYVLIDKSTSGRISTSSNASGSVADNGRVVFRSLDKDNVSPTATYSPELYVRDPDAGTTEIVPIDSMGVERGLNGQPGFHVINARGDVVLYNSSAANLLPGVGAGSGNKLLLSKLQ